jgi:hypothetical protein
MSWEQRGTGTYYYSARRVGGKVVKEYVPALVAPLAAQLDAEQRSELEAAKAEHRLALAELDALEETIGPLDELAEPAVEAAMLAAGFHRHHRGSWRKRCA